MPAFRLILAASLLGVSSLFSAGPAQAQSRELPDFADLAERAGPAVVNIRTTERSKPGSGASPQMPEGIDENDPFYEFFRRFFPPRSSAPTLRRCRLQPPA